jgi:hypothetical protein
MEDRKMNLDNEYIPENGDCSKCDYQETVFEKGEHIDWCEKYNKELVMDDYDPDYGKSFEQLQECIDEQAKIDDPDQGEGEAKHESPIQKVIDQGNMQELIGDILHRQKTNRYVVGNSLLDNLLCNGYNLNQIIKEVQQYCMEEYFKTLSEGQ